MTNVQSSTPNFDAERFSKHSLAVAMLARFLFARKQLAGSVHSNWTVDEVFAAGLLSSLGVGLLPRVSPDSYDRVYMYAKRVIITVEDAFQRIYGKPSTFLTAAAVEVWGLPAIFSQSLVCLYAPWNCQDEFTALCCLNFAVCVCESHNLGLGDWAVGVNLQPEVEAEVDISEAELATLMEAIPRHVQAWVGSSKRAA
jgi:hypothetical protein